MATAEETKDLFTRMRAVEEAIIRMENIPEKLAEILAAIQKREEKSIVLAETIRDIGHADRACREKQDGRFEKIYDQLKSGSKHFDEMETKIRANSDAIIDFKRTAIDMYMRKDAPKKARDEIVKWAGAIVAIISLLAALGIYNEGTKKTVIEAVNKQGPMEIITTNGRMFIHRGNI